MRGLHRGLDHRLVAQMDPVEHPYGQMQRTPFGESTGGDKTVENLGHFGASLNGL